MPNWKKLIVSGSDASLNSLNVTNNVTAQSFTGSFSGSFTAPGATTQVVYNNGGVLAANSGFVYSGSNVGIGTTNPSYKLNVYESNTAEYISAKFQTTHPNLNYILLQNGGGSFNHYIQTNSGTLGLSADENGSSGVIQLKTNNVIAVTVNTSQNVGIGTTSPSAKLNILGSGTSIATTALLVQNSNASSSLTVLDGTSTSGFQVTAGNLTDTTFYRDDLWRPATLASARDITIGSDGTLNSYSSRLNFINYYTNSGQGNQSNFAGYLRTSIAQYTATGGVYPNQPSGRGTLLLGVYDTDYSSTVLNSFDVVSIGKYTTVISGSLTVSSGITGSFSGSFTAPGSTTQIVYNDNGVLAANSGLVYSGSNVGIGISSPTEKLHIVSSATGNQFGRITATDSNSSAAWVAQNDSGDNVVYRVFSSGVSGTQMGAALGRSASLLANLGGSGVFLLGTFSNTNFVLGTNNTENMRITTAGNVGIGTTTPIGILHLYKSAAATRLAIDGDAGQNRLISYRTGAVQRFGLYVNNTAESGANAGSNFAIRAYNDAGTLLSTPFFINRASGNVGIGTTSPSARLDVETASGGYAAVIKNTTAGGDYLKMIGDSGNTVFEFGSGGTGGEGFINIYSDAVQKVLIDANGNSYFNGGNVGIGTTSPGYKLEVVGAVSASTYYGDGSNLTNIGSGSVSAAGSDGQLQYNNSGLFGGASRLYYNDSTNRVGIGTSSPGYDLDVSGSARVQDRLRVGVVNTGNGVIHQSSDATINPLSSTIVWSVPGSSGAVAFIEYYIINTVTSTSQRGGNIVVTWNSAGTPQITHTETTTPDIGTTALVTFTTSITLGGDPQLVATNTSINPFYIVLNYRYF